MFYSHEILTSREGGLATVWLVATLGSRSGLKKVTRKAIVDVDVQKTCDIIIHPEAPMALRLQSNLLYGVSRVFSQQYGYVLSDAQIAQSNIRALLKAVRTSDLDPNAGKARPDQLMVEDDPGFLPDSALPGLDIDLSALNISTDESSRRSSLLSPHSQLSSLSSHQQSGDESMLGLIIPNSDSVGAGDHGGFVLPSDHASSAQRSARLGRLLEDEGEGFDIDPGFSIDAEGNLIEDPAPGAVAQMGVSRLGSDQAANSRVRRELQEGLEQGRIEPSAMDFEPELPRFEDGDILLPEVEAFPAMAVGDLIQARPSGQRSEAAGERESSDSAQAPVRRKRPNPRALPVDERQELRNSDLAQWKDNYITNMSEAISSKHNHQAPFIAKKNAALWVKGIGDVGTALGGPLLKNPFHMFTGDALMEALTGIRPPTGRKRNRGEADDEESDNARRIRMREGEDEIGRGDGVILEDDDTMMAPGSEPPIEIGRHAAPSLEDPSFPWNTTASALASRAGSHAGFPSSVGGFPTSAGGPPSLRQGIAPSSLDRRASRIASASPLVGRGVERKDSFELPMHDDDELLGAWPVGSTDSNEGFQLYGDYTGIGTQTQAQSQWMRATLDREAVNFLDFVKVEIKTREALSTQHDDEADGEEEDDLARDIYEGGARDVFFEDLLPPAQHSKIVAAQGLHHVLALATKGLLRPTQEEGYGPIALAIPVEV